MKKSILVLAGALLVWAFIPGCGNAQDDGSLSTSEELRRRHHDAGARDSAPPPPPVDPDASTGGSPDGTPHRQACTSQFGAGLSATFGRLDGYLVAVVPPGTQGCNGDAHHVHLQIQMRGQIYDVAVNVSSSSYGNSEVFFATRQAPLDGGPWVEGWHPGETLDYRSTLGLASGAFTAESESVLAQQLEAALATANHVSVFATGYGPDGAHLVHRNGAGHDGAIVIEPLSAQPRFFAFHFANQTF